MFKPWEKQWTPTPPFTSVGPQGRKTQSVYDSTGMMICSTVSGCKPRLKCYEIAELIATALNEHYHKKDEANNEKQ